MTTPKSYIVHAGMPGLSCRTAIVLVPAPVLSRLRILTPLAVGVVGMADEEGDVPHITDARRVPNPDGGERELVSWHYPHECPNGPVTRL